MNRAEPQNHITPTQLANGTPWEQVYEELMSFLGHKASYTIYTHNARFDKRLFNAQCSHFQIEPIELNWNCTLAFSKYLLQATKTPNPPNFTLAALLEEFHIISDDTQLHRADTDTKLLLGLLESLASKAAKGPLIDLLTEYAQQGAIQSLPIITANKSSTTSTNKRTRPHRCPSCSSSFGSPEKLTKHIQEKHSQPQPAQ